MLGTDATRDGNKLGLVKETMISAALATTIRRFELAAEVVDQGHSEVKEEVGSDVRYTDGEKFPEPNTFKALSKIDMTVKNSQLFSW